MSFVLYAFAAAIVLTCLWGGWGLLRHWYGGRKRPRNRSDWP